MDLVLFGPFEFMEHLANSGLPRVFHLEWQWLISTWYSLRGLWASSLCIQPHVYSSYELSSGRLGYKSYICTIHLCSFWGTSQSIQTVPVNRSSELWSRGKVTQVNDQIIFGQPHDTTRLWRTYSAVGRNKLAQISLKLDLMGHRDRTLSQGTWNCCCCFITYAETCAFVKLPLVSCSSSTPDFHSSYQAMNREDFVSHDGWAGTVCKAHAVDHHSLPFFPLKFRLLWEFDHISLQLITRFKCSRPCLHQNKTPLRILAYFFFWLKERF